MEPHLRIAGKKDFLLRLQNSRFISKYESWQNVNFIFYNNTNIRMSSNPSKRTCFHAKYENATQLNLIVQFDKYFSYGFHYKIQKLK